MCNISSLAPSTQLNDSHRQSAPNTNAAQIVAIVVVHRQPVLHLPILLRPRAHAATSPHTSAGLKSTVQPWPNGTAIHHGIPNAAASVVTTNSQYSGTRRNVTTSPPFPHRQFNRFPSCHSSKICRIV